MNQIKSRINAEGKVELKGTVDEVRDFEPILRQLPKFKEELGLLKEQVAAQEKQLEALGPNVYDSEVEKFIELSKKVQLINKRTQLENEIATKKDQIEKSEKILEENEVLVKQYEEWKEKK